MRKLMSLLLLASLTFFTVSANAATNEVENHGDEWPGYPQTFSSSTTESNDDDDSKDYDPYENHTLAINLGAGSTEPGAFHDQNALN